MKQSSKVCFGKALAAFIIFILFTAMVKIVDVQPIGPNGSYVGFAGLNQLVKNITGVSEFWYELTEIFGYVALLTAASFSLMALVQWIKGRSLLKVDYRLVLLCAIYADLGIIYVLFRLVAVNYRPILEDGILEASYPSSHTLLTIVVFATALMQLRRMLKNNKAKALLGGACMLLTVVAPLGRLLSGYHWATDVIASVILSLSLIWMYSGACRFVQEKKVKNKAEILFK